MMQIWDAAMWLVKGSKEKVAMWVYLLILLQLNNKKLNYLEP